MKNLIYLMILLILTSTFEHKIKRELWLSEKKNTFFEILHREVLRICYYELI